METNICQNVMGLNLEQEGLMPKSAGDKRGPGEAGRGPLASLCGLLVARPYTLQDLELPSPSPSPLASLQN